MNDLPHPSVHQLLLPVLAGRERRLGDYELVDELATGQSFRIDLALAPSGCTVALKRARGESASARSRLTREAHIANTLSAPNLLHAHELLHDPEPTLVLQYVSGASLRQLLDDAGPEDLRHALWAYIGALHGLAALHTNQRGFLVHQAPVARHMLLGVDGVCRLIDLSHVRGVGLGDCRGADDGLLPSELAPEQIEGATIDPRCDVFIAGRTLRELLERCQITEHTYFDEVWRRATADRPSERYADARELSGAVVEAALRSGLTSTPEQLSRWVRTRLDRERPSDVRARSRATPTDQQHTIGFVPPRASLPVEPMHERISNVWSSMVIQPDDDDVVRAIAAAAARPYRPRQQRRPKRRGLFGLRTLGSGATLAGVGLYALLATGAMPIDEYLPALARVMAPAEASAMAPEQATEQEQAPELARPAPVVVPSVVPSMEQPQAPQANMGAWQRSELEARRAQPKPRKQQAQVQVESSPRELIRMTGSVPENPY